MNVSVSRVAVCLGFKEEDDTTTLHQNIYAFPYPPIYKGWLWLWTHFLVGWRLSIFIYSSFSYYSCHPLPHFTYTFFPCLLASCGWYEYRYGFGLEKVRLWKETILGLVLSFSLHIPHLYGTRHAGNKTFVSNFMCDTFIIGFFGRRRNSGCIHTGGGL